MRIFTPNETLDGPEPGFRDSVEVQSTKSEILGLGIPGFGKLLSLVSINDPF